MQQQTRRAGLAVAAAVLAIASTATSLTTPSAAQAAAPSVRHCSVPDAGLGTRSAPAESGLDPTKLAEAVRFAQSRMRLTVRIYRHNCLVASNKLSSVTGKVPLNIFSSTKSVVAILAGIASRDGALDIDAPIGRYLPAGMGDRTHRAITVRQLLTQSSGLKQSIFSEALPSMAGLDRNVVEQALALPIVRRPGTYFQYSQRGPDLLAYVVERAVGTDLQAFAQERLFAPIGIQRSDWLWMRDRSGHTYGWADLFMKGDALSKIGLLLTNDGRWGDRQLIARNYMKQLRAPSATNPCYGYLVWLNRKPCIQPSVPSRVARHALLFAALPADAYATVGFLHQSNFVVPSLGLTVTWTGTLGDVSLDPSTLISANVNSELYHEFLRKLAAAFRYPRLPDPGPYEQTFNFNVDISQMLDPAVLLSPLGAGPYSGCTILACVD